MRDPLTFAFVREGPSDDGLIPHLRELLVRAGVDEAFGSPRDYHGPVEERLGHVQREEVVVEVVFVHRDADGRSSEHRRKEIADAAVALPQLSAIVVPVIPIQELEAWLLLDELAIRTVVGKPSGKQPLGLPKPKHVEQTSQPKELLVQACLLASATTGRRHREEKRKFPERRRVLLERLDIDGPVRELPAWQAMEQDIANAVASLTARQ